MKNPIRKTILLALIFCLITMSLSSESLTPKEGTKYVVHLNNSFVRYSTSEWNSYELSWKYSPGDKLIMHFSTLTMILGDPPFGSGYVLSQATINVTTAPSILITGTAADGVTPITSSATLAVLPRQQRGNINNGNYLQELKSGSNNVGGSVQLQNSTNDFYIFLVSSRPATDFKLNQPLTITGEFGMFTFSAVDNGGSHTSYEYKVGGNDLTPIADGQTTVDSGYGDYEKPVKPSYSIALSNNAFNLTNAAASGSGEVVSALSIKAKDLKGDGKVNITFSSANNFELVNENVSSTIPYDLYYAASSSTSVEAETPIEVSLTGSGQTTLTTLRTDNLSVKLNPVGSLTTYPAGLYSDTVTITISTDS